MNPTRKGKPVGVLGIMSGTSIDSVDLAFCIVRQDEIHLKAHWQVRFPSRLQDRLHRAARNQLAAFDVARLHHDLGRFFARAARKVLGSHKPHLVGLHGQTIFHQPKAAHAATLQLGEPAYLVEALQVPVVANFRAADLAAGGQGAPLATLFHRVVFGRRGTHVCVNNLGGISNVTSIDWRRGLSPRLLAFDTGPANLPLDTVMRHFSQGKKHRDEGGAWAARGRIHEPLLRRWLRHEFFRRPPPKSTGREQFGEPFVDRVLPQAERAGLSPPDILATLTEFSARSLVLNYRNFLRSPPGRVVLSGGGAANPVLVSAIKENLRLWHPPIEVLTSPSLGWPCQSIEPAAFALLAYYRWRGLAGNHPETTGAERPLLLGQVAEP